MRYDEFKIQLEYLDLPWSWIGDNGRLNLNREFVRIEGSRGRKKIHENTAAIESALLRTTLITLTNGRVVFSRRRDGASHFSADVYPCSRHSRGRECVVE
jgi:hypothetical protein